MATVPFQTQEQHHRWRAMSGGKCSSTSGSGVVTDQPSELCLSRVRLVNDPYRIDNTTEGFYRGRALEFHRDDHRSQACLI